jgi:hypothetical protein
LSCGDFADGVVAFFLLIESPQLAAAIFDSLASKAGLSRF